MNPEHPVRPQQEASYVPPTITYVGRLDELTQDKTVGAADGMTFLGLDIGSV